MSYHLSSREGGKMLLSKQATKAAGLGWWSWCWSKVMRGLLEVPRSTLELIASTLSGFELSMKTSLNSNVSDARK